MAIAAAVLIAVITFSVHIFVGGRKVARPLLQDRRLPPASKWLNYYCWHLVTLLILALAVAYAWIGVTGLTPTHQPFLAGLGLLAVAMSGLSIWVALKASINPVRFPSTTLFALLALASLAAALDAAPSREDRRVAAEVIG